MPCPAVSEAGNLDKEVKKPMVRRDCRDQKVVDEAIALLERLERLEREPHQVEAVLLRESIDSLRELGDAMCAKDPQVGALHDAVDIAALLVNIAKLVVQLCGLGDQ